MVGETLLHHVNGGEHPSPVSIHNVIGQYIFAGPARFHVIDDLVEPDTWRFGQHQWSLP